MLPQPSSYLQPSPSFQIYSGDSVTEERIKIGPYEGQGILSNLFWRFTASQQEASRGRPIQDFQIYSGDSHRPTMPLFDNTSLPIFQIYSGDSETAKWLLKIAIRKLTFKSILEIQPRTMWLIHVVTSPFKSILEIHEYIIVASKGALKRNPTFKSILEIHNCGTRRAGR